PTAMPQHSEKFLRPLHIKTDLAAQLIGGCKFLLIAKAIEKFEARSIEVSRDLLVENKGFDRQASLIECRAKTNVGHCVHECAIVQRYSRDVNTDFGNEFVLRFKIQCRHLHRSATARTGDDLSRNLNPSAKQTARARHF